MTKRFPAGCLASILLVLGLLLLPHALHNLALSRFRKTFSNLAHLPSSVLLKEVSEVGLLEGNGDHCDYLAAQFRETDESPETVLQHYSTLRVPRVDPGYETGFENQCPVYVFFPDTQKIDLPSQANASLVAAAYAKRTRKTVYLVYSIDVGYPPNWDLRCY